MAKVKGILKQITRALSEVEGVKVVILYGSLARGEFTSRSDIDLFIIVSKDMKDKVENEIIELENRIHRSIQPTIRTES